MVGGSADDGYGRERRAIFPLFRTLLVGLIIVVLVAVVVGCFYPVAPARSGGFCPRPPQAFVATPQFNQQAVEVHGLRRHAFRGDFFAQLELGRRYEAGRTSDRKLDDPVEAATWYAIALANPVGFEPVGGREEVRLGARGRAAQHYDDCRAFERRDAYRHLDNLLSRMSTEERDKVSARVIYLLSTQGADGFRTLARLHDAAFGPFGEPIDNPEARWAMAKAGLSAAVYLFQRNDVDAYLYNYLAAQTGDVGAYVLLKDFGRTLQEYEHAAPDRGGFANLVESKANRWIPPYEFYPPESPETGVPHSDESEPNSDPAETALLRIATLPFAQISEAFQAMRLIDHPIARETELPSSSVEAFQAMLGQEKTGVLSPLQKVRAIQMAAVNGSARAQLALAVMYSEGIGVPADYARAYHWYQTADKQGSPEAKYAMSTFFSLGVDGVADQDKAKAVAYQIDAALAGFGPSADRLQGILQRMGRNHAQKQERDPS